MLDTQQMALCFAWRAGHACQGFCIEVPGSVLVYGLCALQMQ